MKNKVNFALLLLLMFGSRFYDVYTTYLYIPDLKGETNVLVSQLSFGWKESLIVQALTLVFLSFTLYIYHFKKVNTIEVTKNHSLKEFVSIYCFNKPDEFYKLLYKLPTNKNAFMASIGGIVPKSMIIISLIVGSSTTFLICSEWYRRFYRTFHIASILYLLIVVVVITMTMHFFRKEKTDRIQNY